MDGASLGPGPPSIIAEPEWRVGGSRSSQHPALGPVGARECGHAEGEWAAQPLREHGREEGDGSESVGRGACSVFADVISHTHVTVRAHASTVSTLGPLPLHTSGTAQTRVSIPALVTTGRSHNHAGASANTWATRPHTLSCGCGRDRAEVSTRGGPARWPCGPLLASQTCWPWGTWGVSVSRGQEGCCVQSRMEDPHGAEQCHMALQGRILP